MNRLNPRLIERVRDIVENLGAVHEALDLYGMQLEPLAFELLLDKRCDLPDRDVCTEGGKRREGIIEGADCGFVAKGLGGEHRLGSSGSGTHLRVWEDTAELHVLEQLRGQWLGQAAGLRVRGSRCPPFRRCTTLQIRSAPGEFPALDSHWAGG